MTDIVTVTQSIPERQILYTNNNYDGRQSFSMNSNGSFGNDLLGTTVESDSKLDREKIKRSNLKRYPHLDETDPLASLTAGEIIKKYISLDKGELTIEEKQNVVDMIYNYRQAFSLYGEISSCPNFEVGITLTDEEPFFIRPYRLSEEDKHTVSRELDKLVKLGILAVGHQSYTSPVFLIPKKGTSDKRVVTDFRYLNDRIKRINHPFPLLNETLRTIGNSDAQILSVLDLKSAFFCLPSVRKHNSTLELLLTMVANTIITNGCHKGKTYLQGFFRQKMMRCWQTFLSLDNFV